MRRGWIDIQPPDNIAAYHFFSSLAVSAQPLLYAIVDSVFKRLQIYAKVAKVNRSTHTKECHYILCRNNQSGWHFCHAVCIFIFHGKQKPTMKNWPRDTKRLTLQKSSVTRSPCCAGNIATNRLNYSMPYGLRTSHTHTHDDSCACTLNCWKRFTCGSRPKILYAWGMTADYDPNSHISFVVCSSHNKNNDYLRTEARIFEKWQ